MNIYVGNLPYGTTEDDLNSIFGAYGGVSSINIIIDKTSGRSKGFGFIEMDSDSSAKDAINALNEKDFQGRNLRVNEAKPRTERPRQQARY